MLRSPCEMLFVNLFVINRCLKKKYSRLFTYICFVVSTLIILPLAYLALQFVPDLGAGNGIFVLFGFLYLFPLRFLYDASTTHIISIACTSWVYTFLVFSLSVHLGYLFDPTALNLSVAFIQTGIYLLTIYPFYRVLHQHLLPMLEKLTPKFLKSFMWMSIFWFWELFILNLCFVYANVLFLKPVALVSCVFCIYVSYRYIYQVVLGQETIETLERIAYRDELTQLRSRVAFYNDAEVLLQKQTPFTLVFIDLDQFKNINDSFGHNVGDAYLAFFAKQVQQRLGKGGHLYRISGDEFVCIFRNGNISDFIDSLSNLPTHLPTRPEVKFLGFSYGMSEYPKDGMLLEELLQASDQRMYVNKNAKYMIHDRRKK